MSTTFDRATFNAVLNDIEKHLGYLKGNELAWVYLQGMANHHLRQAPSDGTWQRCPLDYATPCPQGEYRLEFDVDIMLPPKQDRWATEDEIRAGTDGEWRKGATWAAGIADQVRDVTARVTAPDAGKLKEAVSDMSGVLLQLGRALDPATIPQLPGDMGATDETPPERLSATLGGLANGWHGTAADEFRAVCDELGATLGMYGQFAGLAAAELATATTVIDSAQQGLLKSVRDIRSQLISQLQKWKDTRQPPADGSEFPAWILDLLAVKKAYKGIKLLVEAVTDPKEVSEYLVEIGKVLVGELPGALMEGGDKPFQAARSDEILRSLIDNVRDAYLDDFQAVLDQPTMTGAWMRTGLELIQAGGGWFPPRVPEDAGLTRSGDSYPTR
jgi:hypothetical protein